MDEFIIETAIFDHDGHYVTSQEKLVRLHMRDALLQRVLASGLAMRISFPVAPGDYLVREVVRDSDGVMTTLNRSVQIPF
ncbi:MAG: hypothetical protein ACYDA9_08985 [Terriglobia bacterium]